MTDAGDLPAVCLTAWPSPARAGEPKPAETLARLGFRPKAAANAFCWAGGSLLSQEAVPEAACNGGSDAYHSTLANGGSIVSDVPPP
jgi:hypothetical protein